VLAFTGRFVVARAQSGPGGQVRVAEEELAWAGPGLRDDRGRGDRPDSRDRDQQPLLPGERDHHLLHLRVQPVDHLIEMVDVFGMQLTHQRVVGIEAAL
jgi:hypothetical protein